MPLNPDVNWAVEDVRRRLPMYRLCQDYYNGDHRLVFATEKYRNAFGDLFREFADNLMDDVADEPADRLQILNFTALSAGLGQQAQDIWEANKGDARSGRVHLDGFRSGDGFLIVWQDSQGAARLYPQKPEQMAVRYDEDLPDMIEVAAKVWREGKVYRLNLYYPDRLERYATKGTTNDGGLPKAPAFLPYAEPAETEPGEIAEDAEPFVEINPWNTVPVFHFPNGEVSGYGESALADSIPLQDALNKTIADMLVAMEFHAYPQRWATGVQVERDAVTGKEVDPFQSGAERLWRTGNEAAQFGQFTQADLSQFLLVQDSFRAEIARKAGLPPHSVGAGRQAPPSGISLLVSEGRIIKRTRDRQRDWGSTWLEAMALALRMSGAGDLIGATDLDIEWAPPETRDEKALAETITIKVALGVSKRQGLLEMGYDDDKVEEMLGESQAESADLAAAQMAMMGGRITPAIVTDTKAALDAGLPPGPQPPAGAGPTPFAG